MWRRCIAAGLFVGLCCSFGIAQDATADRELLKHYRGGIPLPGDLYHAYAALIGAIETRDEGAIQQHCLPHGITFSTGVRPEASREYGRDMNMPFLRRGFHKYILNVRKESEDTYLIRTGSSYMWFVRTRSEGWKLYRYGDKPME